MENHYRDHLGEYYLKKIVDIRVDFVSELDTGLHLIQNFPIMAEEFFQKKDKKTKEFWKHLAQEKPSLAQNVNEKIIEYNKSGTFGNEKIGKEELDIIHRLCNDGSNRDRSLVFIKT